MNNSNNKLISFCNSNPSNKLVFTIKHNLEGFESINFGVLLAEKINELSNIAKLNISVLELIDEIFKKNYSTHNQIGKFIFIENLGILLEPSLGINITEIFNNYSRNACLIIAWPGEIENNNFYFLTKENGLKLNLSHLSHITL